MSKVKIQQRSSDFINIKDYIPNIVERMDYATKSNFTGEIIPGYDAPIAILQELALKALCKVQEELNKNGLGLIIYDAYRPHKSVEYLHKDWALQESISEIKQKYYPNKSKEELFQEGFLSKNSSHSRGSTLDLSLIRLDGQIELDMGTIFDYFDETSFTDASNISESAKQNRTVLKMYMEKFGFTNYPKEWWHYSYMDEKYKHFYFDFDIN